MIQRLLLISLLFITLVSCSRKEGVRVQGEIENASGQTAYFEELRLSKNKILDSCELKNNGRFRFRTELKLPGYYQARFTDGQTITLILFPGEKVKIHTDFNNFYESLVMEGSPNSIRVKELHDSLRIVIKQLNALQKTYSGLLEEQVHDGEKLDSINQVYSELRNNYKKYTVGFILKDLRSLANIAALYQQFNEDDYVLYSNRDLQFFKLVSDTLYKYYPRVRYVKILRENYQSFFNEYQHSRLMSMVKPDELLIPDLNLPDTRGINRSLRSLKGRVVLLAFWSFKQPESIQNVVNMQKVYKKFKNRGFEIYQVSIDDSMDNWRKAVAFEDIPWISVCDTAFPESKTRMLYNINTIPLNYLINSDQSEILAKDLTANELDQTLQTLFQQNQGQP